MRKTVFFGRLENIGEESVKTCSPFFYFFQNIRWICALLSTYLLLSPPLSAKLPKKKLKRLLQRYNQAVRYENIPKMASLLEQLAEDNSLRMAKLILKVAVSYDHPRIYRSCLFALRKFNHPKAKAYLHSKLKNGTPPQQIILMEAFQFQKGKEYTPKYIEKLRSSNPSILRLAVEILAKRQDPSAIPALIQLLEKQQKRKRQGLLYFEIRKALHRLTGQDFLTPQEWKQYWQQRKKKSSPYARTVVRQIQKKGPRFFTETVVSDRVVFIIDISASMEEKDPYQGGENSSPSSNTPSNLPNSRMRIERAKNQLIQVISQLPPAAYFNIIAFNDKAYYWSPRMKKASTSRKSAIQWVRQLRPKGLTATYAALKQAFHNKKADTFYLLSDGEPTVGPGTGEILDFVFKQNRFRKIKIYTMGFPGANRQFMATLATNNGGKYSDIR
ncbi:MAG: VWA domain-containing protein [Planctomycetota bacterium]|nr:MAG: VWA domain-containing protein [Planctomycetota bacterium]